MFVKPDRASVRLTGRWHMTESGAAETTAPGSFLELAFTGSMAVLHFDMTTNRQPYGHLWISVDGGARVEVPLDWYLRLSAQDDGPHVATVIYKSAVEIHHRWYAPLEGKVTFRGFEADGEGVLPEDTRKTVEFVGDSNTEGVLVDASYTPEAYGPWNRPWQDDAAGTYAWLTAENLNLRPFIMGYGAVGITKSGQAAVPKVEESYPYCYANAPYAGAHADYIVINHGANDSRATTEDYVRGYLRLLDLIRSRNPQARIIALSAFCGNHAKGLGEAIANYNAEKNENICFIDSTGWVPKEPLHPLREGHKIIARHLTEALGRIIGG